VPAMRGDALWSVFRPRLSETWARAFREDTEWKLILREDAGRDELYRLSGDPEETRNVAGEYPEKAAALREALSRFTGIPEVEIRRGREQRQIPILLRAEDETGREDVLMDQLRKLGYVQ
ncbi:MAG TPA: hypothetical protein PLV45_15860, partial [bacterium]|nr:hypothetical protein [bacterium]